jgi:ankyrin repeat protein
MAQSALHIAVQRGDIAALKSLLDSEGDGINRLVDGYSPLMLAASTPEAGIDILQALIDAGADVEQVCEGFIDIDRTPLSMALGAGALDKVELLVKAGANIQYRRDGYNALLDAVHGHDVLRDANLLALLARLIEWRVDLNAVTRYAESGLRVLSHIGRFDAVRKLLLAGADETQLGWTPLMRAVAIGTLEDVETELAGKPLLEVTDWWSRTAFLIAVRAGDVVKADMLLGVGASVRAVGRCGVPALSLAIESGQIDMARYLIRLGCDVDQPDEFGHTPIMYAVESGNDAAVDLLIVSGADVMEEKNYGPLYEARNRSVILRLFNAGANPADISREGMRVLLGFPAEPKVYELNVSRDEYRTGSARRFGKSNPEQMNDPFWLAMIQSGVNAYAAALKYEGKRPLEGEPVWCADRFGQSWTLMEDGRIILVGGEHEDSYDPDFCIYNDVWVRQPDGRFDIYGYPEDVFPPTDFQTATLVGKQIWLVGSLSYQGRRAMSETQVFTLDTADFRMRAVQTKGDKPGWISRHRARLVNSSTIEVSGGKVCIMKDGREEYETAQGVHRLDLRTGVWSRMD